MDGAHAGWWLLFAGFGGFGLGIGLVLGAFVARTLRRYMASERLGDNGKGDA